MPKTTEQVDPITLAEQLARELSEIPFFTSDGSDDPNRASLMGALDRFLADRNEPVALGAEQGESFPVGYYTEAEQSEPVFDPGTEVDCPVCTLSLDYPRTPIKTVSAMPANGRVVSCFYRVHKNCQEGLSDDEKSAFCATACSQAMRKVEEDTDAH